MNNVGSAPQTASHRRDAPSPSMIEVGCESVVSGLVGGASVSLGFPESPDLDTFPADGSGKEPNYVSCVSGGKRLVEIKISFMRF